MSKTQDEINRDVAEDRAIRIEKLADFAKVKWLPHYQYNDSTAAARVADHIDRGTMAKFTVNETSTGIQLVAFHYNTGIPSTRSLNYPFTVGQLEDAVDSLDDEYAEPAGSMQGATKEKKQ